jgi:hypothetical protein
VGTTRHPPGTIRRDPPGGQDTMELGMVVPWWAPGMAHGEAAALRAELRGGPGDILERLGDGATEQPIQGAGVLQRQGPQGMREGKEHRTGGGREHLARPGGEPRGLAGAMPCGAAAVPARVVRLDLVAPVSARRAMAAAGRRPAPGEGP